MPVEEGALLQITGCVTAAVCWGACSVGLEGADRLYFGVFHADRRRRSAAAAVASGVGGTIRTTKRWDGWIGWLAGTGIDRWMVALLLQIT